MDKVPIEDLITAEDAARLVGLSPEELNVRAGGGDCKRYFKGDAVHYVRNSLLNWARREGFALPRQLRKGYITTAAAAERLQISEDVLVRLVAMSVIKLRTDARYGNLLFFEADVDAAIDREARRNAVPTSASELYQRLNGPLSPELERLAADVLGATDAWWLLFLTEQPWTGEKPILKEHLFNSYFEYCERVKHIRTIGMIGIGKYIKKMSGNVESVQRLVEGTRIRKHFYAFPPLANLRVLWEERHGAGPWSTS
jgi:hypothetical protein